MAQYNIGIDSEKVKGLLIHDDGLKELIQEIRRRERVIRIFPNEASAQRLIGALLAENMKPGAPVRSIST